LTRDAGTPWYADKDLLDGKPVTLHSDLWAIGASLYRMATGAHAYSPACSRNDLLSNMSKYKDGGRPMPPAVDQRLTPACRDMIRKLLTVDPADCIQIDQLLNHPFLKPN
jgi:serine/threonine protein kinase